MWISAANVCGGANRLYFASHSLLAKKTLKKTQPFRQRLANQTVGKVASLVPAKRNWLSKEKKQ
jgi:hypothetical protein